jgi:hypothetical protein
MYLCVICVDFFYIITCVVGVVCFYFIFYFYFFPFQFSFFFYDLFPDFGTIKSYCLYILQMDLEITDKVVMC